MTWIMTGTGRKIDFLNPDPTQLSLVDISISLSRNHRFGGHSPLKIGQHILEVMTLMMDRAHKENPDIDPKELAEIALVGLIHDFPEFAVCDVMTPLKRLLGSVYTEIEDRLLECMLVKYDLVELYAKHADLLKWADAEAVQQEATRYKLDGFYLDDDYILQTRPNMWVPENKEITLRDAVWDEQLVCTCLSAAFIRFMYVSGRADRIGGKWLEQTAEAANAVGLTLGAAILQPLGVPSMLINGGSVI